MQGRQLSLLSRNHCAYKPPHSSHTRAAARHPCTAPLCVCAHNAFLQSRLSSRIANFDPNMVLRDEWADLGDCVTESMDTPSQGTL